MGHDTRGGGHNNETELTGRQQIADPLLVVTSADVETRANAAALVDTTDEVHDDLAVTVVIHDGELTNVT
eukprot:CAMPEP_0177643926 /NCGR_PEP_ID=MMETSP0447-20121125/8410_1 /TAXON_ID=0 /ORGANISM="Stygamoeba regulata, Strain BSH-02190019" /LENGTH=69 /DNA_ID=CAMNT_0019146243 /DNA_START=166 /DNA_END=375 /DNA_ORIENTATION=+